MLLHVIRQPLTTVLPLLQLGVSDVSGDDESPRECDSSLDAVLRQIGEDLFHWLVQVDLAEKNARFNISINQSLTSKQDAHTALWVEEWNTLGERSPEWRERCRAMVSVLSSCFSNR